MKIKSLKIIFETIDNFKTRSRSELKHALNSRKSMTHQRDILIWESVESYQQFMSDQKYAILAVIHKYNPQSVYQLAKMMGRAQQNVARDCDLLAGHGFIKFNVTADGRKTKAPRLIFNYNIIEVNLPSVTYKVEFESCAA